MFKLKVILSNILLLANVCAFSQKIPVVHVGNKIVDIRQGDELRKGSWNIEPSVKEDVLEVVVTGKSTPVTFIGDKDSVRFDVKPGKSYSFIFLVNEKDSALTTIRGLAYVPRARFSKDYIKSHSGKTFIEIPPVYELVNVVFALTEIGRKDKGLIVRNTPYYADLIRYFDQFSQEPIVLTMQSELAEGMDSYHALKMDAYAFEFSADGKIVQSKVYDRIGRSNSNNLRSFIPGLQAFSQKTKFTAFYSTHEPLYVRLITAFRDSVGVPEMQKWLTRNFPSTKYNSFKIIFSPLVGNNQSASWFEDNGFQEAQAHVNFPYGTNKGLVSKSKEASQVEDGNIVFTEMNHSFIGPEGDKYNAQIAKAFINLSTWNAVDKPARYYNNARASFDEYMNWALVNLRYVDYVPTAERDKLIADIDKMMLENRGFVKFPEFSRFLVDLYKKRNKGQTVADLYPAIIAWFDSNK